MRLNVRKVKMPTREVTQYRTEDGTIVAEFNETFAHAIFALGIMYRSDLTIYDEDRGEVIYGKLNQLVGP